MLRSLGYARLYYYLGGMEDWTAREFPIEAGASPQLRQQEEVQESSSVRQHMRWSNGLLAVANWPMEQLVVAWLGMIVGFALLYWAASFSMGWALQAGGRATQADFEGLATAIYFSFVTALSIGYGDVVPVGFMRLLAVLEGAAGLLLFGCVVSKLVSGRQEELTEEIHRTTFEDRLDRVRTNLHLVFSDLGLVQQLIAEKGVAAPSVARRYDSIVRVFRGEMQTIHDLLYRCRVTPDEESLESLLGNLVICLHALIDIRATDTSGQDSSIRIDRGIQAISRLANDICGECVPRTYAPALKETMDQIQILARRLEVS